MFDRERVYAVNDHFAPSPTVERAKAQGAKDFATKHQLPNYFEHGRHGILHQVFPENGYVSPGDLIVSVDSHSTSYGCFNALGTPIMEELAFVVTTGMLWLRVPETIRFMLTGKLPSWCVGKDVMLKICGDYGTDCAVYKSVEFLGPSSISLSLGSRFTMANMGVEIGAKCAIFEADDVTYDFLNGRMKRPPAPVSPDADAVYEATHVVDVTGLEPMVALPHDPSNVKRVSEVAAMSRGRSSLPRFVHERARRRHRRGREDVARPQGPPERADDRDAGVVRSVARLREARLLGNARRSRRDDHERRLRRLSRRTPRLARRQRTLHLVEQPQLPRPHGQRERRDLPRVARDRRRGRDRRQDRRPAQIPGGLSMSDAATQSLTRTGRVWNFGDNVSTDLIMPGAILWRHVTTPDAIKAAIMPQRPGWAARKCGMVI